MFRPFNFFKNTVKPSKETQQNEMKKMDQERRMREEGYCRVSAMTATGFQVNTYEKCSSMTAYPKKKEKSYQAEKMKQDNQMEKMGYCRVPAMTATGYPVVTFEKCESKKTFPK